MNKGHTTTQAYDTRSIEHPFLSFLGTSIAIKFSARPHSTFSGKQPEHFTPGSGQHMGWSIVAIAVLSYTLSAYQNPGGIATKHSRPRSIFFPPSLFFFV